MEVSNELGAFDAVMKRIEEILGYDQNSVDCMPLKSGVELLGDVTDSFQALVKVQKQDSQNLIRLQKTFSTTISELEKLVPEATDPKINGYVDTMLKVVDLRLSSSQSHRELKQP